MRCKQCGKYENSAVARCNACNSDIEKKAELNKDRVKVVRCKDCVFKDICILITDGDFKDDDFCSAGKEFLKDV